LTNDRYAVLFKAFTIDDFVLRRLAHVVAAARSGDVFLMIDETSGPAKEIAFERVIRYRETDVLQLGFANIAERSLFWYNADYPVYYFRHHYPTYEVIVTVEYDAVPQSDLDELVRRFVTDKLDFVGHAINKTADHYWWTDTMLRFYARTQVRPYQVCAAIFSARAVDHLAATRLRHGASGIHEPGEWPIGETFVGTELAAAGFRLRDLSAFGKLTRYDWWPPIHERELADCEGEVFVHPVLAGRRYLKSLFKSSFRSGVIVSAKLVAASVVRASRRVIPPRTARPSRVFEAGGR